MIDSKEIVICITDLFLMMDKNNFHCYKELRFLRFLTKIRSQITEYFAKILGQKKH